MDPWIAFDVVLSDKMSRAGVDTFQPIGDVYQEQPLAVLQRGPSGYYILTREGYGAAYEAELVILQLGLPTDLPSPDC